ncbi:protein NO VEIN domain-containing protein [Streptomyces xanthochromogenes]|uniref:protein NO VEIN domain-containing protein n=1 Tax=Streptomyces xanthochromogenes TaxID=67384 RepID=UPI0037A7059E
MVSEALFVMIHVGQKVGHQRNLEHGMTTRSWGFPRKQDWYGRRVPDFAVLVTGAAPRVQPEEWKAKSARMVLCKVQVGVYEGTAPHWPDEVVEERVIYPYRLGLEPLAVLDDASLGPGGPLSAEASEAARRSGTQQGVGYLVSMDPQPLLDAAGIDTHWAADHDVPLAATPGVTIEQLEGRNSPQRGRRGAGRQMDPAKRKAVELYAEEKAVTHYEHPDRGWTAHKVGKPYDLRLEQPGLERRVEVKGTTGAPTSVELTVNEVFHARDTRHTVDLFIVSDIRVTKTNGTYQCSGGDVLLLEDWQPAEDDLRPTRYQYLVPQPAAAPSPNN